MPKIRRNYNNKIRTKRLEMVDTPCPICDIIMCDSKSNSLSSVTVEHIIPLSEGGQNDLKNIKIICKLCNQSRNSTVIKSKQLGFFGYQDWLGFSLYNTEYSNRMISEFYSEIDKIFWSIYYKRRISQSD